MNTNNDRNRRDAEREVYKLNRDPDRRAYKLTDSYRLLDAASNGNIEEVEKLLASGVDPNAQDPLNGGTALIQAALFGHSIVANILIQAGANIKHRDLHGMTALSAASDEGHTDFVDFIIACKEKKALLGV